jgi:polar amino acid transport system substrate-binding protein
MIGRRGLCTYAAGIAVLGGTRRAMAESNLAAIRQSRKLRVAIDMGNPPHGMMDGKFQPIGSDVETAQLLAKDLGVELEVIQVPTSARVQFLLSNRADLVISALSITPERRRVVEFSIPYASLKTVVAAPASMAISSYADLAGQRVAVTRGTVNDQYLTQGVKDVPNVTVTRFEDDATTSTAVTSGQLRIYASSLPLITQLKQTNPSVDLAVKFTMHGFPIGIALRKDDPELKTYLDSWVTTNLRNGKLVDIYKKWQDVAISPEELIAFRG